MFCRSIYSSLRNKQSRVFRLLHLSDAGGAAQGNLRQSAVQTRYNVFAWQRAPCKRVDWAGRSCELARLPREKISSLQLSLCDGKERALRPGAARDALYNAIRVEMSYLLESKNQCCGFILYKCLQYSQWGIRRLVILLDFAENANTFVDTHDALEFVDTHVG